MCRCLKLLPLLLLAAACADRAGDDPLAPQLAVIAETQSVHGQIYIDFFDEMDTFTATRSPQGTVNGHFTVHSPEFGIIKGTVFCFTIDGNSARIAGTVTKAKDAPFLEGTGAYWTVQDNGEGDNDRPDLASDINFGSSQEDAAAHCVAERIPAYDVQDKANIQINR